MKKIYLVLTDFPSKDVKVIVDFLLSLQIPAIFFCWGQRALIYQNELDYAIKKGFIVGNHSFSHSPFSRISLVQCFEEIDKTEEIIQASYDRLSMVRVFKIMLFPFLDCGAGAFCTLPQNNKGKERVRALQKFLRCRGFVQPLFENVQVTCDHLEMYGTWNFYEYQKSMIDDPMRYLEGVDKDFAASSNEAEVLFFFNTGENTNLFFLLVDFLIKKGCSFLLPRFLLKTEREDLFSCQENVNCFEQGCLC